MARILLVDDDKDLVDVYRMMLTSKGHEVSAVHSAAEARQAITAADQYDLVVLDVMMESLTAGFDLARDLHERWPKLRMVVLSAIRDAAGVPFKFEPDEDWLPVVKFLEKSTDPEEILAEIQKATGGKE